MKRGRRFYQKLALLAQFVALSSILPFWVTLVVGPFTIVMLAVAFMGKRWAVFFYAIDFLIDTPQMLQQFNSGGAVVVTSAGMARSTDFFTLLPWYEAFPLWAAILGFDLLLAWWLFGFSYKLALEIRNRVPRHLWA